MTAKHRDPEYVRNARVIRAQVHQAWRIGSEVSCWRCRRPIEPGEQFDVGHIDPDAGHGFDNLAPEHRRKTAACRGNRSAGGALGAAITNARRGRAPAPVPSRRSRGLLNWRTAGAFFKTAVSPPPSALQPFLPLNLNGAS